MPIEILIFCEIVLVFLSIVFGVEGNKEFKYTASMFVFLMMWIVIGASQPVVVEKHRMYPIHNSPDGYQYSTIESGEMKNLTKEFGKTFSVDKILQEEIPKTLYMGINMSYSRVYKVVDKVVDKIDMGEK